MHFIQAIKTIAWAFLGIGGNAQEKKPSLGWFMLAIFAMLFAFIGVLLLVVRWAVSS